MALKFVLVFLFTLSVVAILALYAVKVAIHFGYLRQKDRKKPGPLADFFNRNFVNKKDDKRWKKAFLMFPLLYAIPLDEEREELNETRRRIKKMNIAIYGVLMVALLIMVYMAKAYPQGF